MKKVKAPTISFILSFVLGIGMSWLISFVPFSSVFAWGVDTVCSFRAPNLLFSPFDGGPLDYLPRLESSAQSPDGELIVKVYRQRDASHSRYVGAEMFARIYDQNERLLYETVIGTEGAWDEMNGAFQNIEFKEDTIRISRFFDKAYVIYVPRTQSTNSSNPSQWHGFQIKE